jgi:hypothetical protein
VVTATPKGRAVHLRPIPTPGLRHSEYQALTEDCQALPYGLRNTVNMVSIREHREGSVHTLPEDGDSSTRSTHSVHTEVEHLKDDGYDLDPLPYVDGS